MYIKNIESIKNKKYVCGKTIGKYLIKKNIPLLSREGKKMIFSYTDELQKSISEMPLYLKLLVKVGVING